MDLNSQLCEVSTYTQSIGSDSSIDGNLSLPKHRIDENNNISELEDPANVTKLIITITLLKSEEQVKTTRIRYASGYALLGKVDHSFSCNFSTPIADFGEKLFAVGSGTESFSFFSPH